MIVSASYKTDIPAFYGPWFENRLAEGFAEVVNPWSGKPFTVDLTPEAVSGFVFWSRNARPFRRVLERLSTPFLMQYTLTGYPAALEVSTIAEDAAVADMRTIAAGWPGALLWRYDPIVFSEATPATFHRETVARLARKLEGATDECVVSIAHVYRKTRANMNRTGLAWWDPAEEKKRALLADLAGIVARHGMRLALCGQPDLLVDGVAEAACIDAPRLSRVAGHPIPAKRKPHRDACACAQSRDIGAYHTCPHGCAYCYAVSRRETAKAAHAAHDPAAARL